MQKNDLHEIIKKSFLNEKDKDILYKMLERQGESEEFYSVFSQFITDAINKKGDKLLLFINKFENIFNENESDYFNKQDELLQKLHDNMQGVKSSDIDQRSKAWDEYYEGLKNLRLHILDEMNEQYMDLRREMID